jgi:hypothetical protein
VKHIYLDTTVGPTATSKYLSHGGNPRWQYNKASSVGSNKAISDKENTPVVSRSASDLDTSSQLVGSSSSKHCCIIPPTCTGWGSQALIYLKEHDVNNEQFQDEMIAMNKAALDMNKVPLDMNQESMEL